MNILIYKVEECILCACFPVKGACFQMNIKPQKVHIAIDVVAYLFLSISLASQILYPLNCKQFVRKGLV